jgi:hypothetical protein
MKADRNRNAASVDAIEALVDASERQVDRLFAQDGDPQRNAGFDVVSVSSGWRGDDNSRNRASLERVSQRPKGLAAVQGGDLGAGRWIGVDYGRQPRAGGARNGAGVDAGDASRSDQA